MLSLQQKPLISRYRLKSRGMLNSISNRREFEGALIQIDGGYGCIHPWPELGDPPLEKCLTDLAGNRYWPIVRRAVRCAIFDAAARSLNESLFDEMEIPESHATLPETDSAHVALAVEAGFSIIKLKTGRNLAKETKFLESMIEAYPALKWRLDFNEVLSPGEALEFLSGLSEKARAALDFVEDPCPFSENVWKDLYRRTRVPLAVDHEAGPQSAGAQVMVIKPAVDEPFLLGESAMGFQQRVILTSYMDHPFGQSFAAWEAARLELEFPGLVGVCGLQTHHLFEKSEFTEALGPWSPKFKVPAGTGLGFDDYLDALPWTRLY
jgi:o-succinylbenzoate synthase